MNILSAMQDPNLFGVHFRDIDNWQQWIVVIKAILGERLTKRERKVFRRFTGREWKPCLNPAEVWLIVGRRGGKSKIVALLAVVLALFEDHSASLTPGEAGHVMVIATDRKQARVVLRYVEAYLDGSELLSRQVVRKTAEAIELDNGIHITVVSCSLRSVRGYTVVAAICDEIAFWRDDTSANPDTEVLNALRPAMATIPGAKLICLSSPYARRGVMWEAYRNHYRKDVADVLVWQAATYDMNPTIRQSFLDREREKDRLAFRSEYEAQFRTDVASALAPEWIDAALTLPVLDTPVSLHSRSYFAFADMSGGRSDSAALAIAHPEPDDPVVYVDAVRRWRPPFSPEAVVREMCELLGEYRLQWVTGDNYSAELVVELFSKQGVTYERSDDSAPEIYLQSMPLFSTGRVSAPDHRVLRQELSNLERRTRVGGRDLVTHPPGGHDDLANATCGAILGAWRRRVSGTQQIQMGAMSVNPAEGSLSDDDEGSAPWRYL